MTRRGTPYEEGRGRSKRACERRVRERRVRGKGERASPSSRTSWYPSSRSDNNHNRDARRPAPNRALPTSAPDSTPRVVEPLEPAGNRGTARAEGAARRVSRSKPASWSSRDEIPATGRTDGDPRARGRRSSGWSTRGTRATSPPAESPQLGAAVTPPVSTGPGPEGRCEPSGRTRRAVSRRGSRGAAARRVWIMDMHGRGSRGEWVVVHTPSHRRKEA